MMLQAISPRGLSLDSSGKGEIRMLAYEPVSRETNSTGSDVDRGIL
jgi:hypothetical protein